MVRELDSNRRQLLTAVWLRRRLLHNDILHAIAALGGETRATFDGIDRQLAELRRADNEVKQYCDICLDEQARSLGGRLEARIDRYGAAPRGAAPFPPPAPSQPGTPTRRSPSPGRNRAGRRGVAAGAVPLPGDGA